MIRALVLMLAVLLARPVLAVQPDEVLDDPVLEARAREISRDLRCLVCRNESIDESNAPLARDLRLLVRERLTEGDSNEEVVDFVVARFGEYVLLRPLTTGSNLLLWIAGPGMLVFGLAAAGYYLRRRRPGAGAPVVADLTEDERQRLAEILRD